MPTLPVRSPEWYRHGRNWKEPQLQYQYCPLVAHLASYARSCGRDPGVRLRLTPLRLHYPGSSYPALSIRSYYPLTTDVYLQLPIVLSSWLRDAEQLPTRAPRVLASPQLAAHRPALRPATGLWRSRAAARACTLLPRPLTAPQQDPLPCQRNRVRVKRQLHSQRSSGHSARRE